MRSVAIRGVVEKLPVVRGALRLVPKYHVGSVTENRLGLQVLRVLSKGVTRSLRASRLTPEVAPLVRVLEHDGILVLPKFLEADRFSAVIQEFDAANAGNELAPYRGVQNAKLFRRQINVADSPLSFSEIRAVFQDNDRLSQIVSAIIRRPIVHKPDVLLDTYQCVDVDGQDNDIENILHADLHVPTIKMFFYLDRADQANGAFVYAKGSHKLTMARLLHEYDMSVRQAKLTRGLFVEPELLEKRASLVRNIIRPVHRRRMKVVESQICVEPNTLVITNNMGFHRRGEFSCSRPRKALLVNYRNAEPAIG